ncbi:MAG: GntR family transcriptional regulator [Oscillospiraceae bacterium]|nr:GntR family transcriptional regulator [Oscillospiraceae bacterium]
MIHLDYRDARPIYAQIIDALKAQISSGALRPGDKLPSVRELAATLAINPNTIQRAYRLLEFNGWIVTIPGKGCFVCENEKSREQEIERWYTAFDEATAALLSLGISREQMIHRLEKNSKKN